MGNYPAIIWVTRYFCRGRPPCLPGSIKIKAGFRRSIRLLYWVTTGGGTPTTGTIQGRNETASDSLTNNNLSRAHSAKTFETHKPKINGMVCSSPLRPCICPCIHGGGSFIHNVYGHRVDHRAKPPLAGCVNREVVEQAGLFPTMVLWRVRAVSALKIVNNHPG